MIILQGCEEMVEPIMDLVEEPTATQEPPTLPLEEPAISLNAISKTPSPNTM